MHELAESVKPLDTARERPQQQIEHQVRLVAQVIAELKFVEVRLEVLLRDADIRPVDAPLETCPEAFQ